MRCSPCLVQRPLPLVAEPDRAQATPPVAEETPSEDDVVDMAAVLEQREKREQPQLVDPEKISGPLKKHVFGQDDALNDIAELVAVHKMRKKEKILTVMLLGPTATGKSETAKSLAEIMTGIYGTEYGCIEVAGSEFASSHTVNRFFGAPPGYVGQRPAHCAGPRAAEPLPDHRHRRDREERPQGGGRAHGGY